MTTRGMWTGYKSIRARIEMAVARGDDLDRICTDLGVEPSDVDRVLARMDALNASMARHPSGKQRGQAER